LSRCGVQSPYEDEIGLGDLPTAIRIIDVQVRLRDPVEQTMGGSAMGHVARVSRTAPAASATDQGWFS